MTLPLPIQSSLCSPLLIYLSFWACFFLISSTADTSDNHSCSVTTFLVNSPYNNTPEICFSRHIKDCASFLQPLNAISFQCIRRIGDNKTKGLYKTAKLKSILNVTEQNDSNEKLHINSI